VYSIFFKILTIRTIIAYINMIKINTSAIYTIFTLGNPLEEKT
jgi:hypothetical protein